MENIMVYLPGIALAYSAFLLAIISPGPNSLAVIGTSMGVGRSSGIALALGVAGGSFVWALLTVVGLTAVLATYAWALMAIKIFGGCYLLWLAYKSFKAAASAHDIDAQEMAGGRRTKFGYARRGFLVQMTNPKAALSWVAIISLGLAPDAPLWVGVAIIAGTTLLSCVIYGLYAVAFSTPIMVSIYTKSRRYVQATLGAFFTFAGIKLLFSRT